jgi:predicted GNAT superfamily acetyltransferase
MKLSARDLAAACTMDAEEAATEATVEVRLLATSKETDEASGLFAGVWSSSVAGPMPAELCRALAHSGNYVAGAFRGELLVGAIVGFSGHSPERDYLHSHIAAVSPDVRGQSVGFALKLHQRAWAATAGLRYVEWTFDPLVRANAHFNLTKLRVTPVTYHRNFYGRRNDGVNDGSDSDRLLVVWDVADGIQNPLGSSASVGASRSRVAGATLLSSSPDGRPQFEHVASDADRLLVAVPDDILGLRIDQPELALAWREAVRAAFEQAIDGAFRLSSFTADGYYVLERSIVGGHDLVSGSPGTTHG